MRGLERLQVLVADDNREMRAITATVLRSAGFRHIHEACSGEDALAALRHFPADLAIVDYKMSPMNGVEFTSRVRSDPDSPNPYLPIIMLTGHARRDRVSAARDAGITEFLAKPITARTLLGRIETIILKPRPFAASSSYTGPCRRRRNDSAYAGPFRRAHDGDGELIVVERRRR